MASLLNLPGYFIYTFGLGHVSMNTSILSKIFQLETSNSNFEETFVHIIHLLDC